MRDLDWWLTMAVLGFGCCAVIALVEVIIMKRRIAAVEDRQHREWDR